MTRKKKVTRTRAKRTKKGSFFSLTRAQSIILGSLIIFFSIGTALAFISYFDAWQADQSVLEQWTNRNQPAQNLMSKFGAGISHFFIYKGFGVASFILLALLFFSGLWLFLGKQNKNMLSHWFWGLMSVLWFSVFFAFIFEKTPVLAGITGFEINNWLQDFIGKPGVLLLLLFNLVVFVSQRFGVSPEKVVAFIKSNFKKEKKPVSSASTVTEEALKSRETLWEVPKVPQNGKSRAAEPKSTEKKETEEHLEVQIENRSPEPELTTTLATRLVSNFGEFDPRLELENYHFPGLDLLEEYGQAGITIDQQELEENKNKIVETLKNYKIGIARIKATIGPTVTLYEIVPAVGIRIAKIKNLEDDIALSLAALGIRIIAPIPGRGTIGIEVPNKKSSIVSMHSVIASARFQKAEMELPLAIGKTISNETFVVDLAKMPHLLMAGATGQGKSVGLNAIITSLLYKKHPAEIKFVLVDPKKVELTLYNKLERHFLAKLPDSEEAIITDNSEVIKTLNSLCTEMDRRYDLLKEAMVRNLKEYNNRFKKRQLNPEKGHAWLPYIILVIDEFADLIMTAGKELEAPLARLAQLARAVGIHLIIATQRPSVNVITGLIKANFPARIAFRVTSKIDSRTILDAQGANQLIGRGDMLFTQGNEVTRLQCAFVDTPEIGRITDYIGSQRAYPDAHLLPEFKESDSGTAIDINLNERDSLFKEAAEVLVISQQGSASLLQRKLKLGYNRAGRLIDQLEAAGIVGPFEGSKARQVLVSDLVSLERLLNSKND